MRAYLLLRDNRKTGPLTFEQLLTMGLTSLDLIWVEGYSQRWKHPTEIEEFSGCAFARPWDRQGQWRRSEVLPGIRFRLPVHDIASHSWGPVPTLAVQGLDIFMAPPTRQYPVVLPTDDGEEGLSLFSVLPQPERSVRVSSASGHELPLAKEAVWPSKASLRVRQGKGSGKILRRSRKKYPHHLDLSDFLAGQYQPDDGALPVGFAEGGFHIDFD